MAESTSQRIIAEAALAKKFGTEIDKRANQLDIPALVTAVEKFDPAIPTPDGDTSPTNEIEIARDTDGVPYLK